MLVALRRRRRGEGVVDGARATCTLTRRLSRQRTRCTVRCVDPIEFSITPLYARRANLMLALQLRGEALQAASAVLTGPKTRTLCPGTDRGGLSAVLPPSPPMLVVVMAMAEVEVATATAATAVVAVVVSAVVSSRRGPFSFPTAPNDVTAPPASRNPRAGGTENSATRFPPSPVSFSRRPSSRLTSFLFSLSSFRLKL